MNRLVDEAGDDPTSGRGMKLLRGTPATPATPDMKRRVWVALHRAPVELPGTGLRALRLFAVGAAIVLFAGTAGAMITGRWIVPALDGAVAPAPRAERPARVKAARRVAAAPEAAPAPTMVSAPVERHAVRPAAAPSRAPAPTSASVARERTEVLDALIALRRDHDAARAGALLDRYLMAHRRGVLREEALALSIEAADARGDRPLALKLARMYQNEFPQGRFHPFARSHEITLDGSAAGPKE